MTKEYILPISCKTADKIKSVLYWSVRIGMTALSVLFVCLIVTGNLRDGDKYGFFFALTIPITLGVWAITFISWDASGSIPKFKCRCD